MGSYTGIIRARSGAYEECPGEVAAEHDSPAAARKAATALGADVVIWVGGDLAVRRNAKGRKLAEGRVIAHPIVPHEPVLLEWTRP